MNTGGAFGCSTAFTALRSSFSDDELSEQYDLETLDSLITTMEQRIDEIYRNLWRSFTCARNGVSPQLTCPQDCEPEDFNTDPEENSCTCSCVGQNSDDWDYQNLVPCLVTGNSQTKVLESLEALPNSTQRALVEAACSASLSIGDSLEAASPQDPSFFPIHPTLERLWARSKLAGKFTDESWDGWSAYGDACRGHWPDDDLAVGYYLKDLRESTSDDSSLRLSELYEIIDPTKFQLDYVFDNFVWQHCSELGFQMDL